MGMSTTNLRNGPTVTCQVLIGKVGSATTIPERDCVAHLVIGATIESESFSNGTPMTGLSGHIDKYLGVIESGWSFKDEVGDVQVVKVLDCPVAGVIAYSTLGMSWTKLAMPGDRMVRQELLLAAYERYPPSKVASFLLTFCKYALSTGRALLRGDVVGPYQPLIPGVAVDSVFCTLPVMFSPGLKTFSASEPHTVFVWLVPITSAEARFIRSNGWNRFEDLLEKDQPDFWDLDRASL
jgi:Suppressor of fused protein (SUFU)